jgi:type I restriction enzyme S subunit
MQKFEQGTTRKRITRSHLQSIKIPVPPLEEQKEISDILTGVDSMLEIYDSQKQRLQRLKKGLMQKLLTGKIRVKV